MNANNSACEIMDCPICMDSITSATNRVTTECGHCFHTSCLMANVAHNGFGCPYCRTEMAEEPEESTIVTDDFGETVDDFEPFDDNALRGLRLFMDNIEGVEHAQADITAEDEEEEGEEEEEDKPTPAFIAARLVEQGVTMEDLVKVLLLDHDEYESQFPDFEHNEGVQFGRLRIIISNYTPEQQEQAPVQQQQQQQQQQIPSVPAVDFDAQPKIATRRMLSHV